MNVLSQTVNKKSFEIINTYGNATRDYTSLITWLSDTDKELTKTGKTIILDCYDDHKDKE